MPWWTILHVCVAGEVVDASVMAGIEPVCESLSGHSARNMAERGYLTLPATHTLACVVRPT